MHEQPLPLPKSAQQGVVLLEVMIAILIFSMGVLAIVGLQAVMVKNTTDSKYRSDASYIAQQAIGRIWADPGNAPSYVQTNTAVPSLPNGTLTVTQPDAVNYPNQFTFTITWQQPGAGEVQHNFTTTAQIAGG